MSQHVPAALLDSHSECDQAQMRVPGNALGPCFVCGQQRLTLLCFFSTGAGSGSVENLPLPPELSDVLMSGLNGKALRQPVRSG